MKYSKSKNKVPYWKYCIPFVAVLLLVVTLYKPEKIPMQGTLEVNDSIVINSIQLDSTLDKTYVTIKAMYETERLINLFDKIPFMKRFFKQWTLEYNFHQYTLIYHGKTSRLVITIALKDAPLINGEENMQISTIQEIPVTITHFDDCYQAYFEHQDYFYDIIGYHMEESYFIQLLTQMIGEIK